VLSSRHQISGVRGESFADPVENAFVRRAQPVLFGFGKKGMLDIVPRCGKLVDFFKEVG
jgi:hypothetical protein